MLQSLNDQPYQTRLKSLGLPSLEFRRERADMIQVYGIKTGIDQLNEARFFPYASILADHAYLGLRSNAKKIDKRRSRTEERKSTFS